MVYTERYTEKVVQVEYFRSEDRMLIYINENYGKIEVIQIYTTQHNTAFSSYQPTTHYHLMYKVLKIKEKVMI